MSSSSSSSPCAACKFLRRKCTQGCVFAPHFPADQPRRFENVHRVFGASNVAKLLNELDPAQREDTVNSLAYEAGMRLRDPVYGSVGYIFLLQHRLRQLQQDLDAARKELAGHVGHGFFAPAPFYPPQNYMSAPQAAVGPVQPMLLGNFPPQQQQDLLLGGGSGQELVLCDDNMFQSPQPPPVQIVQRPPQPQRPPVQIVYTDDP